VSDRALLTEGQVEMVAGLAGNPPITTVKIYNPSTDEDARALAVTGRGNIAIQLANDVDVAGKQALNVLGNTYLESCTGNNAAHKTLEIVNSNANEDARALKVSGRIEFSGDTEITGSTDINGSTNIRTEGPTTLTVFNGSQQADAVALQIQGGKLKVSLPGIICEGILTLGSRQTAGQIEGVPTPAPGAICIGVEEVSGTIVLGRVGQNVEIISRLIVGPSNDNGLIDANNSHNLELGTQNTTVDVEIGRNGRTTWVIGGLNVAQTSMLAGNVSCGGDVAAQGSLFVGPIAAAGTIDAGGDPNATDLEIGGGDSTANVVLSRDGQIIDHMGNTRLNSNEFMVDDAANLVAAAGTGFVYNTNGNGFGVSIDFYTAGTLRGWIDSNGWTNA